jgi:hypothetical protein
MAFGTSHFTNTIRGHVEVSRHYRRPFQGHERERIFNPKELKVLGFRDQGARVEQHISRKKGFCSRERARSELTEAMVTAVISDYCMARLCSSIEPNDKRSRVQPCEMIDD